MIKTTNWNKILQKYLAILFMLLSCFAQADDTVSRTSFWAMSLTNLQFTEKVKGFVDIQPRFTINDISGGNNGALDTLLMRGAVGYQLAENVTLFQGYAYIPTYDPKRAEHRSFQQLSIKQGFALGSLSHRLRLEQRDVDRVDDTAYRFRYFARYVQPLESWHPKLSLAINEEVFINLNDTDDGPQSGFNQNRLFFGLNYRINPNLAYEFGYQNQYINRTGGKDDISNHILFVGVQTKFSWLD